MGGGGGGLDRFTLIKLSEFLVVTLHWREQLGDNEASLVERHASALLSVCLIKSDWVLGCIL